MTQQQEFRIYPDLKENLPSDFQATSFMGRISLKDCALIAEDGTRYRLNFLRFAINDPLSDMNMNAPISKVVWFLPLDQQEWFLGYLGLHECFAFQKDGRWMVKIGANDVQPTDEFKPIEKMHSFKRCLKAIQSNGNLNVLSCFVWETPKFIMQQLVGKKFRYSKLSKPQDHLATAFVDHENGSDIVGYIYPN